MSTNSTGRRSTPALRWSAGVVLGLAGMTAWVQMTTAAGNAWSIEPGSDSAIAAAAASRPAGVAWAALLVAVAVTLAALTGRRWLAVLALPALVVAVCLLLAPGPNGAAFFSGLSASVVAVAAALFLEAHRRLRERAAARPVPD